VLKDMVSTIPTHEPDSSCFPNKSIVKKNHRHKEQSNSDLNFTNKRLMQAHI
jgi:hypothetical protein